MERDLIPVEITRVTRCLPTYRIDATAQHAQEIVRYPFGQQLPLSREFLARSANNPRIYYANTDTFAKMVSAAFVDTAARANEFCVKELIERPRFNIRIIRCQNEPGLFAEFSLSPYVIFTAAGCRSSQERVKDLVNVIATAIGPSESPQDRLCDMVNIPDTLHREVRTLVAALNGLHAMVATNGVTH